MGNIDELEMIVNKCDVCLKSFKNKKTLTFHVKYVHQNMWHYERKPAKCEICYKTFKCNNNLKNHKATVHLGQRNYICEKCGQYFQCNGNLITHYRKAHLNFDDKTECDVCNKLLSTKYLKIHKTEVHYIKKVNNTDNLEKQKCDTCSEVFVSRSH